MFVLFFIKIVKSYVNHSNHSQAVLSGTFICATYSFNSWGFSTSQCVDSSLKSSSPVCSLNYKMNFVIFLASLYISCPYLMKSHPFVLYLFVSSWILQDSQISNGYSTQPSNLVLVFENCFLSPLLKSLDNVLFLLFALNLVHPVNLYTFIFQFWSIFLLFDNFPHALFFSLLPAFLIFRYLISWIEFISFFFNLLSFIF